MSKKQEIYIELLELTLPSARNILSHKLIYGRYRKYCYNLCELTHNLYISILEEGFVEHDIWFLNHQARAYFENSKGDPYYEIINNLIKQLFSEAPESRRDQLEWSGP